jgi:hypothetical protein
MGPNVYPTNSIVDLKISYTEMCLRCVENIRGETILLKKITFIRT